MLKTLAAVAIASLAVAPTNAVTFVSVESAGVVNTTRTIFHKHVESFDTLAPGSVTSFTGATGVYSTSYHSMVVIKKADQYGGATGHDRYVDVTAGALDLTLSVNPDYTYFGAWISALDGIYDISFRKGGNLIDTIDLVAYANAHLSSAYKGNPTAPYAGKDSREKFAFFNFDVVGGYDKVVISKGKGGGLESDNHTVGYVDPIPEPAVWGMMIAGFGLVGYSMRRRMVTGMAVN